MLWCFERDDESLKLESRCDNDTSEFAVIVRHPDGRRRIEWFTDGDEDLEHQQWTRRAGPIIMPDGWPNERLM